MQSDTEETWIDQIVLRQVREDGPGLALAMIQDGEVIYLAGYGLANIATGAEATVETQFHMASCGKQFTGLGIMMLREEGRLDFDDHIGRHIPELAAFPEGVTVRRLLHHLSGVLDVYEDDDGERRLLELSALPTNEDLIRFYNMQGCPAGKPGSFAYSNSGYDLLGCVIERVSRQRYRDFFAARVFGPLGMRDTFSMPGTPGANSATGYEVERGQFVPQSGSPFDHLCGSGSFWSTVTDLCGYETALRVNRLVSPQSMQEALTRGIGNWRRRTDYGFGWYITDEYMEHLGGWTGFSAYVRRYLDGQFSIYALSNNASLEVDGIVDEIMEQAASGALTS